MPDQPQQPDRDLFGNTPKNHTDWSHRRGEPRGLALGWTVYLMASAIISFGPSVMALASTPSAYRPAAVRLTVLVAVGLYALLPLVRLSQAWPLRPARSAMVDLCVLLCPALILVWPQMILAWWPVDVTAGVSALLVGWSLILGAILTLAAPLAGPHARAAGPDAALRLAIISAWYALIIAAPLAGLAMLPSMSLGGDHRGPFGGTAWMFSPISGVFEITRDRSWSGRPARTAPEHWASIGLIWIVAALLWSAVLARRSGARPSAKPTTEPATGPEPAPMSPTPPEA